MKNFSRWVIICILPLFFLSCSTSPKSTVEKMRDRACHRDIQGFFGYVDKAQVQENFRKQIMGKEQEKPSSESGKNLGLSIAGFIMSVVTGQIWQAYEDEIKKGEEGELCKMRILTQKTDTEVILQFPNGNQVTWGFTRYDNKWMLTSLSIPQ